MLDLSDIDKKLERAGISMSGLTGTVGKAKHVVTGKKTSKILDSIPEKEVVPMAKTVLNQGLKIGEKSCPSCDEILGRTLKVCSECGHKFGKGHGKKKIVVTPKSELKKKKPLHFGPSPNKTATEILAKGEYDRAETLRETHEKIKKLNAKYGREKYRACPSCDAIYSVGASKCMCGHVFDLRDEKSLAMKDILNKVNRHMIDGGAMRITHIPEEEMYKDPWEHRSEGMTCKTCMWMCNFRCRKNAPTMGGYPAVYSNDWCGAHKLAKESMS